MITKWNFRTQEKRSMRMQCPSLQSNGYAKATSETRSSDQGNCSAKSLAPVMLSILPCPPCLLRGGGGSSGGRGRGRGLGRGRGQGTFHPPYHTLHYHMVLRSKGTSHIEILTTIVTAGDPFSHGNLSSLAPHVERTPGARLPQAPVWTRVPAVQTPASPR